MIPFKTELEALFTSNKACSNPITVLGCHVAKMAHVSKRARAIFTANVKVAGEVPAVTVEKDSRLGGPQLGFLHYLRWLQR
mmetsp:Transcript_22276/g.39491  ORF Transcript_22276/g.39491 Transcript_22276/m.39491 type:complete len:81 (-) Transcript_22276:1456-1698(-)